LASVADLESAFPLLENFIFPEMWKLFKLYYKKDDEKMTVS
jgi:hypothetical protein